MEDQNHRSYRAVFEALWNAVGKPVLVETPIQSTDLGAPTAPQTKLHTGILERASGSTEGGAILLLVSGAEILCTPFAPGTAVSVIDSRGPSFLFPRFGEKFSSFGR